MSALEEAFEMGPDPEKVGKALPVMYPVARRCKTSCFHAATVDKQHHAGICVP